MLYRLFKPTPELADIVSCYWFSPIEANVYSEQRYATPLFESIIFNFTNLKKYRHYEGKTNLLTGRVIISGQITSPLVISGRHKNGGHIIGLRFKPLGLAKITGINVAQLTGRIIDGEALWGNEVEHLCESMQEVSSVEDSIKILEDFLIKQLRSNRLHYHMRKMEYAISLIQASRGNISCRELQDLSNVTMKTLERLFMNFSGLSPKTYNKIFRFNVARQLLEKGYPFDLTKLAYEVGYFDQSHFIKDFERFSGQTPTAYKDKLKEERRKRTFPVD